MARIYPFRAFRYNPAKVKLEDVVTQPYDKITPEMQDRYYARHPLNLIRVILGKHFPGDTEEGENVYTRAADTLNAWRTDQVLVEEAEPAIYGYSQVYTVPGTTETRERRGFIALGHLYDYADQVVYRHEQTFPKHKSDRLALFKATRAYCEQIYMLYNDPGFSVERLLFENGPAPDQAVVDDYGVLHKLWKITDPSLIRIIVGAMQDKKLIIADGHHRYETSVAYSKERAAELGLPFNPAPGSETAGADEAEKLHVTATDLPTPAYPEAAMMMTFVNMAAPGITILPTHRVLNGLQNFSADDLLVKAAPYFDSAPLNGSNHVALKAALDATEGVAFVAVTARGSWLLTAKSEAIAPKLQEFSPRQRQLDVVQLHGLLFAQILGLSQEQVTKLGNVKYLREASEAVELVNKGEADVAFLTKPVTLQQLRDVAFANEVMPQKSTDFYPKLLSGLAIYALD
ncbi:MAG: DUF1015 domain-containing protein [Acidobacteriaceae bacterium]|nr:DUF1015 domain-containing protein [Acidobacteriaceae bacterium]